MTEKVVEIYCTLIKEGRREIEKVPENIRAAVQARLDADSDDT
ncbi:CD1375 family protein [Brevibacillus borstelensis]|nr:CD1375 family protein [Brevibacillus borstelensis]WNF07283.1 CD1375 family protein [Brevibacillus borstelensis]